MCSLWQRYYSGIVSKVHNVCNFKFQENKVIEIELNNNAELYGLMRNLTVVRCEVSSITARSNTSLNNRPSSSLIQDLIRRSKGALLSMEKMTLLIGSSVRLSDRRNRLYGKLAIQMDLRTMEVCKFVRFDLIASCTLNLVPVL